jgi:hypothetical protein
MYTKEYSINKSKSKHAFSIVCGDGETVNVEEDDARAMIAASTHLQTIFDVANRKTRSRIIQKPEWTSRTVCHLINYFIEVSMSVPKTEAYEVYLALEQLVIPDFCAFVSSLVRISDVKATLLSSGDLKRLKEITEEKWLLPIRLVVNKTRWRLVWCTMFSHDLLLIDNPNEGVAFTRTTNVEKYKPPPEESDTSQAMIKSYLLDRTRTHSGLLYSTGGKILEEIYVGVFNSVRKICATCKLSFTPNMSLDKLVVNVSSMLVGFDPQQVEEKINHACCCTIALIDEDTGRYRIVLYAKPESPLGNMIDAVEELSKDIAEHQSRKSPGETEDDNDNKAELLLYNPSLQKVATLLRANEILSKGEVMIDFRYRDYYFSVLRSFNDVKLLLQGMV